VLANMLANAVKFTERGDVVVTATVDCCSSSSPTSHLDGGPDAASERQRFHLTIQDTGIGISPESMQKLFQCFRQGHESMTRKYGGTGAGQPFAMS
jgi:signal transduction histidine kinase